MKPFDNILFPVDFSLPCTAIAPYVKRAAEIFGAKVTLAHVFDLGSSGGLELYVRPLPEVLADHHTVARNQLSSFLVQEFPMAEHSRIVLSGDVATRLIELARTGGFDLIIMPTHASHFRSALLGSTTAKVLNGADCPVLTTQHAEMMVPRSLRHREWVCGIDLSPRSEWVLRFASNAAAAAGATLTAIHAIPTREADSPIQLDLDRKPNSSVASAIHLELDRLQKASGSGTQVRLALGPIREVLLEAARRRDADVLLVGREPQNSRSGRLGDFTYKIVRDSPCPVVSI
jgi:nucleotide-binding universal stress UspA family protein